MASRGAEQIEFAVSARWSWSLPYGPSLVSLWPLEMYPLE
jgi:hypothetical protein